MDVINEAIDYQSKVVADENSHMAGCDCDCDKCDVKRYESTHYKDNATQQQRGKSEQGSHKEELPRSHFARGQIRAFGDTGALPLRHGLLANFLTVELIVEIVIKEIDGKVR